MTLEDLDVENKFTLKLPQYIRQFDGFFKFMKMLSNYILKSEDAAKQVLNLLNLDTSEGDVLVKIAKKVNVLYNKKSNSQEDLNNYYNNLKTGILGMQTKRLTNGSYYELKEALLRLFSGIKEVQIIDNLDMTVDINIVGDFTEIDEQTIENYIIPRVTGVKFNITYIPYGVNLFAFDKDVDMGMDTNGVTHTYGEKGWDLGEWKPLSKEQKE